MADIAKWRTSTTLVPVTRTTVSVLEYGGVSNECLSSRWFLGR
jgi:hypothetical protein